MQHLNWRARSGAGSAWRVCGVLFFVGRPWVLHIERARESDLINNRELLLIAKALKFIESKPILLPFPFQSHSLQSGPHTARWIGKKSLPMNKIHSLQWHSLGYLIWSFNFLRSMGKIPSFGFTKKRYHRIWNTLQTSVLQKSWKAPKEISIPNC